MSDMPVLEPAGAAGAAPSLDAPVPGLALVQADPLPAAASSGDSDPAPACELAVDRRFASTGRLLGGEALARLRASHVVIVGLGGVGSWAAEALARSGVGRLTLVDLDHVAESNLNRQVLATEATLGMAKAQAMAERIAAIVPDCVVAQVEDFVTADNAESLLPADADVVIDACDAPRAKAAMVALARTRRQAVLVSGAAGGRIDPTMLRRTDLAEVTGDRLLASVRSRLRRDHGFPAPGRRFGVTVVHSIEAPAGARPTGEGGGAALACAGYGSLVTVTAAMGLALAAGAIDAVAKAQSAAGRKAR